MALILFGGGVADMRGSVGGTTYARNKAGAYARNRTKPINPGTVAQGDNRASFGDASTGWSILTQAQRDAWNAYAAGLTRLNKLGQSYVPSGRQIYVETTRNLVLTSDSALTVPSAFSTNPSIVSKGSLSATLVAGALTVLSYAGADVSIPGGGTGKLIIALTPPVNGEKQNVTNLFRTLPGSWAANATANIFAAYSAIFGTAAVVGQQIWIKISVVDGDSGLRSAEVLDNITLA